MLHGDLHVTDWFRAFVELGDDRIFGRRGNTSTTDVDRWDLMQRFVDLRLPSPFGDAPTVRYGREELLFGYQRLVAVREGPNVRRDFDGLRIHDQIGEASLDFADGAADSGQPLCDRRRIQRRSAHGRRLCHDPGLLMTP